MNISRMSRLVLAIMLLLASFIPAYAQVTFDGCVDIRGIPVASILSYGINDVAIASLAPNGAPVIQYNPSVLSFFQDKTRMFWYAHECGHHALGHAFGTAHPMAREQQADCWAIKTLVKKGLFDDDDVQIVQGDLSQIPSGDWTHLPGPQRAINLKKCLGKNSGNNNGTSFPPSTSGGFCCDAFGNRRCPINNGSLGSGCFCPMQGYGVTCQ